MNGAHQSQSFFIEFSEQAVESVKEHLTSAF